MLCFKSRSTLALICFVSTAAYAGQTRTWSESEYADFEKGNLKNLSLRSDGVLSLAPRFEELYDSSSAYLWALARDSKGTLYAGGGPGAKLYRITPGGEKKMLVELEGLEIHAVAVDSRDRLYAATAPDGKVYRVSPAGKAEVFYNPKQKYIWAMAFDKSGNLFVATGDQGEVHRVTPDGKGSVFFKTDEIHARSLVIGADGNLIVGTDPGGLILRVTPAGEGFVVYQAGKKEITAVAAAADGSIYATAVGNKQPGSTYSPPPPAPAPTPTSNPANPAASTVQIRTAAAAPATMGSPAITISGGSDLYRIDPSGNPQKLWSNSQDIAYTVALDESGRPLVGTGNKGTIFRVDSDTLYTALINASPTQITAILPGPPGVLYTASGNVGKVYQIGPGLEKQGSIESDVFDAGFHSLWGRLEFHGTNNGGAISIATRTGNLDQPKTNWSRWSSPVTDPNGARVNSPAARFAQWKATLRAGSASSPELEEVDFAYLPKNVPPRVDQVEITPPNYRFPPPPAVPPAPATLNLPPIGKRQSSAGASSLESGTPAMQHANGYLGARWTASDDNGDSLLYTVEIRGVKEKQWKLLKDKIKEKYFSFDSTAFPDGEYLLRVTASDLPSNPPAEALCKSLESDPFLIDNTPPVITGLTATRQGGGLEVRWKAADALNSIRQAEYSLDGGEWTVAAPVGRLSDSLQLDYNLVLKGITAGEHTIAVRVTDEYENPATAKTVID